MKWFRWYRDTVADAKLRTVALRANCHMTAAIAFWAALLEDASKTEHRGICKLPIDVIAVTLDLPVTNADAMRDAMAALKMIRIKGGNIHILKWGERQFESDADGTARERQRRKRLKDKETSHTKVTRDSSPPEDRVQNTDSEKKEREEAPAARTPKDELAEILDEEHAKAVVEHRQRKRAPLTAYAAKLLAKQFAKCPDPNAAADAMIAGGWQGFKSEWLENRQARAGPKPDPYLERLEREIAEDKAREDQRTAGRPETKIPELAH